MCTIFYFIDWIINTRDYRNKRLCWPTKGAPHGRGDRRQTLLTAVTLGGRRRRTILGHHLRTEGTLHNLHPRADSQTTPLFLLNFFTPSFFKAHLFLSETFPMLYVIWKKKLVSLRWTNTKGYKQNGLMSRWINLEHSSKDYKNKQILPAKQVRVSLERIGGRRSSSATWNSLVRGRCAKYRNRFLNSCRCK